MSARFVAQATQLSDVLVLQRRVIGDQRGYLQRMYCASELAFVLAGRNIVQANHSFTAKRATVRGMHFQRPPHAEMKFISCLRGKVFDVAVDVRSGSPTFLRWHGEILTPENQRTLVIPEGVAHGFQTLTEDCELLYFHTALYDPASEGGLNPRDPLLAIAWPEPIADLSPRDAAHPALTREFAGVAA